MAEPEALDGSLQVLEELLAYVEAAPSQEELLRYLETRTVTVEELETPSLPELLQYLEDGPDIPRYDTQRGQRGGSHRSALARGRTGGVQRGG